MLPTTIGTPLNELPSEDEGYQPDPHGRAPGGLKGKLVHDAYPGRPLVRHIVRPNQLARRRKIIEIRAMAVTNYSKIDPKLERQTSTASFKCILNRITEIEQYLENKSGDNAAALRGCAMIRDVINNKIDIGIAIKSDTVIKKDSSSLDAPSKVFSKMNCDMYGGGHGDNELIGLLMEEAKHGKCD